MLNENQTLVCWRGPDQGWGPRYSSPLPLAIEQHSWLNMKPKLGRQLLKRNFITTRPTQGGPFQCFSWKISNLNKYGQKLSHMWRKFEHQYTSYMESMIPSDNKTLLHKLFFIQHQNSEVHSSAMFWFHTNIFKQTIWFKL